MTNIRHALSRPTSKLVAFLIVVLSVCIKVHIKICHKVVMTTEEVKISLLQEFYSY
jgi:hypothetical protein